MENQLMIDELLNAWEETYKKGQLTFWVFLALKQSHKCVEEIKEFVEKESEGTMSCEEQSLYRNLRKFQQSGRRKNCSVYFSSSGKYPFL